MVTYLSYTLKYPVMLTRNLSSHLIFFPSFWFICWHMFKYGNIIFDVHVYVKYLLTIVAILAHLVYQQKTLYSHALSVDVAVIIGVICVQSYWPLRLASVFLDNYMPKCQMSSGPYGPLVHRHICYYHYSRIIW